MSEMVVPVYDPDESFPTLGPQVCDWIETYLVFGPGDLLGEPAVLDADTRALIYRLYEVFPPYHPQAGRRRFRRAGISLRKGSAKCLHPDTPVTLGDGGQKLAGEIALDDKIASWDGEKIVSSSVSGIEFQPLADMYEVVTECGRSICVTGEHPFLVQGSRPCQITAKRQQYLSCDPKADETQWVAGCKLEQGDRLVVGLDYARSVPTSHTHDPWMAGLIVGDGSGGDGRISNVDEGILDRVRERYPLTQLKGTTCDWYARGVRGLMREYGLLGLTARTKKVPDSLFSGSREEIAAFLSGYLDADGHVQYKSLPRGKKKITVAWDSVNHQLLNEVQTLLVSIGINARLRKRVRNIRGNAALKPRFETEGYVSWTLAVTDIRQAAMLAELLQPAHTGKRERLDQIKAYALDGCRRSGDKDFQAAGVRFDRVKETHNLGTGPSIAIEIADTHTHVTAGLVTHNTEKGAWITAAELASTGPVRCDGFDANGLPVGRPVINPYIPMVAVTVEQSEELAYSALKEILALSELSNEFDIGMDRILRADGHGKAEAVAGQPGPRDGARTTFQLFDESHRLKGPKLREAHKVMMENIVKRKDANGWSLEVTTAPQPGEESIAELTWRYAEEVAAGKLKDPDLFFFHRQASDGYNLDKEKDVRAAIIEASGETVAEWSDIEGIISRWRDPMTERSYFERVWLNRKVQSNTQVFDIELIRQQILERKQIHPPRGTRITLGFDGSRTNDATGIIGTEIETGYQFVVSVWERPPEGHPEYEDWEVPVKQVEQTVEAAFDIWRVDKMYCDPYYWDTQVDEWYGKWPKQVVRFLTNQEKKMAYTLKAYVDAWKTREVWCDGHKTFIEHLANARKRKLRFEDDEGEHLYVMTKENRASPLKIDLAMAGCLSWAAKGVAVSDGALKRVGSRAGRTTVYVS